MIGQLLKEAKELVKRSYAPYSNFKVAAVLFGEDGKVGGVNVENASYGLSICAERSAVFRAISEGKRRFNGIFVYSPNGIPYPCGACRQVLKEFFREEFKVIVASDSFLKEFLLGELLPFTFELGR